MFLGLLPVFLCLTENLIKVGVDMIVLTLASLLSVTSYIAILCPQTVVCVCACVSATLCAQLHSLVFMTLLMPAPPGH